ncbi:MAG: outer membrane beta-barrel protein [Saprospiraceae bacterium]|nr:outer membrane beta-barrel protein [Saprospiraceae bacterium]
MFRIIAFIALLLGCHFVNAQDHKHITLHGNVSDSTTGPLSSATVVLLQQVDSVMTSFAITDVKGNFELKRVSPGDYVLQSSFLGYYTFTKQISIGNRQERVDLGEINLQAVASDLDAVVVKGDRIPIMINKDTIEYNAEAFKTQPNDVVEDLLRKLPGVEVEADGTVKAQGEEVQQILVDGKEFFGRDPQIATKNLPAGAVDKVQVFDKKSDMAEFTGIDDGADEKAINIELKEDHKKGVFGNVAAGYGTKDRYEGKANLNKFSKNQQLSFIGMSNNVNRQGFSMNDFVNFAGGMGNLMRNGGGRNISNNAAGIPLSEGLSNGFVQTDAAGLNLNQDFGTRTKLNASYFYSSIRKDLDQDIIRENIVSERSFISDENEDETSINANHRLNVTMDHKIDSTQNLRLRANLSFNNSEYSLLGNSQTFDAFGEEANSSLRDNVAMGENINLTSSLMYRKKFQKIGRSLTATLSFGTSADEQEAHQQSINDFIGRSGMGSSIDSIVQDQFQTNDALNYGVEIRYTEPLGKNKFLGLDYERKNNTNELKKDIFDLEDNRSIFNGILSNHYNRDYIYDRGTASLRWIKGNSNLSVGMSLQNASLVGEILSGEGATIEQYYTNWLPRINWNFDLASSKSLRLNYTTNVREPSLTQLQPIVDNSNPLSIYIGNPDLLPEYTHRLQFRYFSFSQFSMTNFFAMLTGSYTDNAIINARTIDEQFRQTTTPVNVDSDYRLTSFLGLGTPAKWLGSRINLNGNFTYNRGRVFVNSIEENTDRYISSINLSFDNLKKELVDLMVGGKISHSLTEYSISQDLDQAYVNQSFYGDITFNIKDSWSIGTKLDYHIYSGGTFMEAQRVPLWSASISKFILKNRGEIKLAAYDILNKNVGIQQSIDLNYLEETRITSLSQYFMLSFTYAINQLGNQQNAPRGFRMMRRPR